ncbi:dual specificity protein phosphatase family protein [Limnobacter sp. P1]|uniref:dual specificity protein phosphatase family protein n=1 Tax=Limnobacter olei TaxID=3031298 RepID=UPI0023B1E124|nr:dual specificity protein phosphatase [Limnobacter sp. P1]
MIHENIHEVRPNLWIGSLQGASEALQKPHSSFTHAVSCIEICPRLRQGIVQLHIPVSDNPDESLLAHFQTVCEFINQAHQNQGKVIVHCEQGISRSAALIAAHLIDHGNMNVKQALLAVYSAKPAAKVNPWFVRDLVDWHQHHMLNS